MRIAVFLLAVVASALLLPAVAHTQEPTGSISGHIVFVGPQPDFDEGPPIAFIVFVIPAHKPQPINLLENLNLQNIVIADMDGTVFAGALRMEITSSIP